MLFWLIKTYHSICKDEIVMVIYHCQKVGFIAGELEFQTTPLQQTNGGNLLKRYVYTSYIITII